MAKIKAQAGQSFFDLAIMSCGTAEAAMDFAAVNGVSVSDFPVPGVEYLVPGETATDPVVLKYWTRTGIVVGSLGLEAVEGSLLGEDGDVLVGEDGDLLVEE